MPSMVHSDEAFCRHWNTSQARLWGPSHPRGSSLLPAVTSLHLKYTSLPMTRGVTRADSLRKSRSASHKVQSSNLTAHNKSWW